jgi:hypothetical protein
MTVSRIMLIIFAAVVLVVVTVFVTLRVSQPQNLPQEEKQINFPVHTPKPFLTPVQTFPDEPKIGMGWSEFRELCGNRTSGKSSEYASGRRDVEYYAYTDKRAANRCVGYFVFEDFVLVSIHSE